MSVQAFGYMGIGAADLDSWTDYATTMIGMQAVDRGGGGGAGRPASAGRPFRMDDRRQRLFIDPALGENERVIGYEVTDAAALDALAGKLDAAGVAVRRQPAGLADQRFVRGLIAFTDPVGNRLEAFHGPMLADEPFQPGRSISGFRTGPLGMGHAVLVVPRMQEVLPFYLDLLGFRVSDYILKPVTAYFLRANPRHHSLALFQGARRGMHHLMLEFYMMDDVGQAYDLALGQPDRVAVTLGRHPNDLITSFYMRTPSSFLVECGWGGAEVDEASWQPEEMQGAPSFWGHKGLFDTLADGPPPGAGHHPPPPPVRRAPLQVMDGNYNRLGGVCPWWDQMKAGC